MGKNDKFLGIDVQIAWFSAEIENYLLSLNFSTVICYNEKNEAFSVVKKFELDKKLKEKGREKGIEQAYIKTVCKGSFSRVYNRYKWYWRWRYKKIIFK